MNAVIYIHGKGGSSAEADHYRSLIKNCEVVGFDYLAETPWEAVEEFDTYFQTAFRKYRKVSLIANSIGAYYSLCALGKFPIQKAFLISPIVNMEALIGNMMQSANVTEEELRKKAEIRTASGENLSWRYLSWVRSHPIEWSVPTEILYAERDFLQSLEVIRQFAVSHHAGLTVMENGEHWFHTEAQMRFLDAWLKSFICVL